MLAVHRFNLNGGSLCGDVGPCSNSGVTATCPTCVELSRPIKDRLASAMFQIEQAAAQYRKRIIGPDGTDHGDLTACEAAALLPVQPKAVQS